ncbi:MAG: hypothetical protein K2Y05_03785, partial [Hyphomicrobiaceae bacterium]|nr:hypothetical protein [Hyphomicrobiaceae bacterium]
MTLGGEFELEHPGFFKRAAPMTLAALAARSGAEIGAPGDAASAEVAGQRLVIDIRALAEAGPDHGTFLDNRKYLAQLQSTSAAACFVAPAFVARVPAGTVPSTTKRLEKSSR